MQNPPTALVEDHKSPLCASYTIVAPPERQPASCVGVSKKTRVFPRTLREQWGLAQWTAVLELDLPHRCTGDDHQPEVHRDLARCMVPLPSSVEIKLTLVCCPNNGPEQSVPESRPPTASSQYRATPTWCCILPTAWAVLCGHRSPTERWKNALLCVKGACLKVK
jgi:hypothetical protein